MKSPPPPRPLSEGLDLSPKQIHRIDKFHTGTLSKDTILKCYMVLEYGVPARNKDKGQNNGLTYATLFI